MILSWLHLNRFIKLKLRPLFDCNVGRSHPGYGCDYRGASRTIWRHCQRFCLGLCRSAYSLVCINSRSPAVTAIDQNGCFCVNLLGDTQTLVVDCFSGRTDPSMAYEFGCADWYYGATGAPILAL